MDPDEATEQVEAILARIRSFESGMPAETRGIRTDGKIMFFFDRKRDTDRRHNHVFFGPKEGGGAYALLLTLYASGAHTLKHIRTLSTLIQLYIPPI